VTSIEAEQRRAGKAPSPWTPAVVDLLRDWSARASASAETHFATAADLARRNVLLGVPVVVLTTFVGTSVFATLEQTVGLELRIMVGLVSVLAAVLASLQTFLRFAERAERHRAAGERWAAINREIAEMVALHPTYLASRGDPKQYLDELRRRMDEIAAESPPMPSRAWGRTLDRHEAKVESRGRSEAQATDTGP
jgi:hypothetical protein